MDLNSINTKKFENNHSFLSQELLIPNANKTDCNRINMFCSHVHQIVTLKNSEFPKVFTGFENQIGNYSTSFKIADRRYKIIDIIPRNKLFSVYVLESDDGYYDIIELKAGESITEHYGYQVINEISHKKPGDIIHKDELIFRSNLHDSKLNFTYGNNLNSIFLSSEGMTNEDAIIVSESTSKLMTSFSYETIEVNLNNNDILCNLYGNHKNYKCFPDIGEHLVDQVLLARRRQIFDSMLYDGNTECLNKINFNTDTVFYSHGRIIDIEVYSNNRELDEYKKADYYSQILKYYDAHQNYYKKVVSVLEPIVQNNSKEFFSDNLSYLYKRCRDILDPNIKFKHNKKDFTNFILVFHILKEEPLVVGSKITGRYGK